MKILFTEVLVGLIFCPLMTLSSQQKLNCISCPVSYYYAATNDTHGACQQCPGNMTTFPDQSAHKKSQCVCDVGYFESNGNCVPCTLGFFKNEVGNSSICTSCQEHSTTRIYAAWSQDFCECLPGYNDVDDIDVCVNCPAGFYKDFMGDSDCLPCNEDVYCPPASIVPTPCPAHSQSSSLSKAIDDCVCSIGYYGNHIESSEGMTGCQPCLPGTYSDIVNSSVCLPCPENTFSTVFNLTNVDGCISCPSNSSSLVQSSKLDDCICNLGFSGEPGDECLACVPGKYLDDVNIYECKECPENSYNEFYAKDTVDACLPCQAHTTSSTGSPDQFSCVCDSGFRHEPIAHGDTKYECVECQPGSIQHAKNSSSCEPCTRGTFMPSAAQTICLECPDGQYSDFVGATQCIKCEFGKFQPYGVDGVKKVACLQCPANSTHSLLNSTSMLDCVCDIGFFNLISVSMDSGLIDNILHSSETELCRQCPPGTFCPGDEFYYKCPSNHFSETGQHQCTPCSRNSFGADISHETECLCVAGTEGTFNKDCVDCEPGKFQAYNFTNTPCSSCELGKFQNLSRQLQCNECPPKSLTTTVGASKIEDCLCVAGYYGDSVNGCNLCPKGQYCPGGHAALDCPVHTQSPTGSSSINNCTCNPGFFASTDGVACIQCPPNHYCPGGPRIFECSNNSSSSPRSSSITSCVCDPGMWRGCIKTSNGTFMNTFGVCDIDYQASCRSCGEDMVCLNNTLLHCPAHSSSPSHSDTPDDCICDDGYYKVDNDEH